MLIVFSPPIYIPNWCSRGIPTEENRMVLRKIQWACFALKSFFRRVRLCAAGQEGLHLRVHEGRPRQAPRRHDRRGQAHPLVGEGQVQRGVRAASALRGIAWIACWSGLVIVQGDPSAREVGLVFSDLGFSTILTSCSVISPKISKIADFPRSKLSQPRCVS